MGRSLLAFRAPAARPLVALLVALTAAALPAGAVAQQASEVVTPSTPTSGSGEPTIGGFSARALDQNGNVTPQTYFTIDLPPGGSYSGKLLIANQAKTKVKLRIYPVDGLTGTTTGTVYANKDDTRKATGLWITPAKEVFNVDGEDSRQLGFSVQVPASATPGDHVGAIAMEAAKRPKASGQFAVKEIIRVAVAVQVRVTGDASPALKIESLKLEALGGTQVPSVVTQLHNTGGLLCRPELTVSLSKDGTALGTVKRQLDTVLPGDSIPYPLPWPKALVSGTYEATAGTTGCGKPGQASATLELKNALNGTPQAPGTILDASDDGGGIPWWVLALAVAAAVIFGFLLARRKPRRKDEDAPAPI